MTSHTSYVYIRFSSDLEQYKVRKVLARILQDNPYEVEMVDGVLNLTLHGGFKTLGILQASFKAASEDLDATFKGLIVPFFDERFCRYLNYVKNGNLKYLFEIGAEHPEIYEECQDFLKDCDSYTMNTVKAYIEAGNSPSLAAYRLYVHRNTVTYRIDRFIQDIGIDLKLYPNVVFIYFLISKKLEGMDEVIFED